jgi:hypothetical protein
MTQPYDIIGDIHGQAEALAALLAKLGYEESRGAWRHSERQVIFLGDFVDVGPRQVETVRIARAMVEAGSALAVMGNHELNAIAWYLPDPQSTEGDYLRSHFSKQWGAKNRHQHAAFLSEVEGKPLHGEIIEWFLTLPLWLDLPQLRIVHACWHSQFIEYLRPKLLQGSRLSKEIMVYVTSEPTLTGEHDVPAPTMFTAVEMLTKGLEIGLPEGHTFPDKLGIPRSRVRVRWWDREALSFQQAALLEDDLRAGLPATPLPQRSPVYDPADKPVFIGHYWLTGQPAPLSDKVVCVDYSAAKGGSLCSYRWDGDALLDSSRFLSVNNKDHDGVWR